MKNIEYKGITDEGQEVRLESMVFRFIPAHYLHSSGNFHVYDPEAKILNSENIGAALEEADSPMFVDDFAEHADKIRNFHQRWMPSSSAKKNLVARVRELEIDIMAPQHGRIFRGEVVQEFLEWFDKLEVGIVKSN